MAHAKFKAEISGDITTAISEVQKAAKAANVDIDLYLGDNETMKVHPDSNIMDLLDIYDLRVKIKKQNKNAV